MADKQKKQCPNCGKEDSVWSKVKFLNQEQIDFINQYSEEQKEAYCDAESCGLALLGKCRNLLTEEINNHYERLQYLNGFLGYIPVVSLPSPQGWNFEVFELITAQTTTGTGAITEIVSQVADFMGSQSERHNTKIQDAILLCKRQLQSQVVEMGGNAVIGCDVDITMGGTGNGLMIVCMTGTVVKVKNTHVFKTDIQGEINEINEIKAEIERLKASAK